MNTLILIGGGARSGKSAAAIQRAMHYDTPRTFIATAEARDDEMRTRIARHQQERHGDFETIEAPIRLAEAIQNAPLSKVIVIDCLTLWLSNLLLSDRTDDEIDRATDAWLAAARAHAASVIAVTNEVGQGIVPEHPLGRRFRDLAGRMNARVAQEADEVEIRYFGLPLRLKPVVSGPKR